MNKMLKYFQKIWKHWTNDYEIVVKSIKLVSPYVIIFDFTSNDIPYYLTIDGNYKLIRSKFLSKNVTEPISFEDYMEEINLFIPVEDIINSKYEKWKKKL